VALVNHTFDAGLQVLFQMNSSNSFGSPPVSEAFTVPTHYENGYACNAFVDLEAAIPVAGNRTYRWISVANPSQANSAEVAIGEIWVCGSGGWRRLTPYDIRHEYTIRNGHLVVSHRSVKGVHTRYDVGARDNRSWAVAVGTDQTGLEQLLEWEDDARHPAYPSLVSLDEASSNQRDAEPRIVIVTEALESRSLHHGVFYTVEFALQELGFGEPIPV
jgi:hypothetical protein